MFIRLMKPGRRLITYNTYGKTKEIQNCYFQRCLEDIKSTKKYILDTFKYREYAENFSKKIKKAIKELGSFWRAMKIQDM